MYRCTYVPHTTYEQAGSQIAIVHTADKKKRSRIKSIKTKRQQQQYDHTMPRVLVLGCLFGCFLFGHVVEAFYMPGVRPHTFSKGEGYVCSY